MKTDEIWLAPLAWRSMPPRARALVETFGASEGVSHFELMARPQGLAQKRRRYQLWAALYAEEDADGNRLWTLRQIGEWFGVAHGHVSTGVKAVSTGTRRYRGYKRRAAPG